jgi:hypothetical protein
MVRLRIFLFATSLLYPLDHSSAVTLPAEFLNDAVAGTSTGSQTGPITTNPTPGVNASSAGSQASTSNDYGIPRISAMASSTAGWAAAADSRLTYYIEFNGALGTVTATVQSFGAIQSSGINGTAEVRLNVDAVNDPSNPNFNHTLFLSPISESLNAISNPNPTNDSFTINGPITFWANEVYMVQMIITVGAQDDGSASAYVDPFFVAPVGYSVSILNTGIGNSPLTAATPIPAALPLFATGLGALGLLGWRRKKKAAALAA